MPKLKLHWWILIGIGVGILAGWYANQAYPEEVVKHTFLYQSFDGIARIFLNLLKMVVVPLVFFTLVSGLIGMGDASRLGRIGTRTFGLYILTSLIACVSGLLWVNTLRPGANLSLAMPHDPVDTSGVPQTFWDVLVNIVPSNVIDAAARTELVGVIFFAILFGVFILKIGDEQRETMTRFIKAGSEVMMKMVGFVIALAPIGIAGLIARMLAIVGLDALRAMLPYVLTVFLALFTHMLVTLPILVWVMTRRNPYRFLSKMMPALVTGFSSASSSGTLGVTMERAEKGAGISNRIASFVLPIGATVNMDGTALYEIVTVLFIAQVHAGVDPNFSLTIGQQLMVVFLGLTISIGAAGIPHAGLVMMVIILHAVGLPIEYTGLIWTVDRVLDMLRTSVNISGDSCITLIVAHGEGEIADGRP
ncbi:MAG: dicarboxylate/amino acid:cation symporter [Acidobacteriota bacterium]|nr:dicarboxylate/amino acid:cation symporter [Acidobacteriota bacterium]